MEKLRNKLEHIIVDSPLIETVIFAASVIVSGVLCGSFVNELTVDNKVQWQNTFKISPTYFILFYLMCVYIYNKFMFNVRRRVKNFASEEFLSAYVKSQLLPEIVADFKKSIRKGESVDYNKFSAIIDIKKIMDGNITDEGKDK
ncbi:hypothetical protein [Bacillus toyonensis]|uniref:hypothetical protein n=1 Tax=Bacillus toyonensis TaxID=155322 RepID=UPI001C0C29F4|nr:hypothetical protein [Bacillus toyonensis]MBU4639422.1 hypothetical protein [Bacillus toyonensis]